MSKVSVSFITVPPHFGQALILFSTSTTPSWHFSHILAGIGKFIWDLWVAEFNFIVGIGTWIWNLIVGAFDILVDIGTTIWNLLTGAFNFLSDAGSRIWNEIILPAFKFLENAGSGIWNEIIKPAFEFLSDVGTKIWDILKGPFQWVADQINNLFGGVGKGVGQLLSGDIGGVGRGFGEFAGGLIEGAKGILGGIGHSIGLGDFVVTPSGTIQTSPGDYIIGTKNPKTMGGGMNVTINIDKPTLTSQSDIKKLSQEISLEIQKTQRRYNSFS